jgi:hypothetical protein
MNEVDDKDILLQFLDQATQSENTIRNTTRATMNYYSTLLLSLTGGILLISKGLDGVLFGLCFLLGGVCLTIIPNIAFLHYRSDYRRQIEMITIQAKLEDILGFTDIDKYKTTYWNHEPIIPPLYVSARKTHPDSVDFVNSFIKSTDMIYVRIYYLIFSLIGMFYIGYGIYKLTY